MKNKIRILTIFSIVLCILCCPALAAEESLVAPCATYYDGSWNLYHYSAPATGEVSMNTCRTKVNITSAVTKVTSVCSTYYTTQASDGSEATVVFSGSYTDLNGNSYQICTGYHYSVSTTSVSTSSKVPAEATIWLDYGINSGAAAYYNFVGNAYA